MLSKLSQKSVSLIIDDPPYGHTQEDEWEDVEPDWPTLAELYHRVLADDGQVAVFGQQPSLIPVYNAFDEQGFELRFEAVWRKKNSPWVSNSRPIPIHENVFVFSKKGVKAESLTFNLEEAQRDYVFVCDKCGDGTTPKSYTVPRGDSQKSSTQGSWEEEYQGEGGESRYPISVLLEYNGVNGNTDEYMGYAGQKPTDLMRWLIVVLSNEGDVILDPHAGSATTLVASIPLLRKAIGIEKDPARWGAAKARIEEGQGEGEVGLEDLRGLKHAEVVEEDLFESLQVG